MSHLTHREGLVQLNSISDRGHSAQTQNPPPLSLEDKFKALPPQTKWAAQNIKFGEDEGLQVGGNVAAAIFRGDAKAVSDGSYKEGHGTSSFTLQGDTFKKAINGQNTIPGSKEEQCAFRSELGGVAGILTTLEILCEHHGIEQGKIEIGLDGESVIKKLEQPHLPSPKDPHCDLLLD